MSKAVAVKNVVWLGGQEWATCRTPGQAARVAEDMNAVYTLELRMHGLLDTVGNPAPIPEGAPGSLQRRAWDLGRRLREAESGQVASVRNGEPSWAAKPSHDMRLEWK